MRLAARRAGGRSSSGSSLVGALGVARRPPTRRLVVGRPAGRRPPRREPRRSSRLTFSEHVSADLGGVRVLDADGDQVQEGAARVDGATVEVDLAAGPARRHLRHQLPGRLRRRPPRAGRLGVRRRRRRRSTTARSDASTDGGDDRIWEVAGAVGRALAYGGVLLAAGGRRVPRARAPGRRRARPASCGSCGRPPWSARSASLVALPGAGRPRHRARARARSSTTACSAEVAQDGVGLGLVLALVGLAGRRLDGRAQRPRSRWPGAAVAAASFATNGHTRAGSSVAAGHDRRRHPPAGRGGVGRRPGAARRSASAPAGAPRTDQTETIALVGPVLDARDGHDRPRRASAAPPSAWIEVRTLDALTEHRATGGCCS